MPVSDQGTFQNRYQIIPRVLIFATRGDCVLLLKGSPTKRLWANLYNGIGGHIEKGESVKEAAYREFIEETGLQLANLWLCAITTINTNEPTGIGMFVFRGSVDPGDLIDSNEGTPEWVKTENILDLPLVEDLPTIDCPSPITASGCIQ